MVRSRALDLIGKVFLNRGDRLIIERPGYLGAIQAFSMYEPEFVPVPLCDDGIETGLFRQALDRQPVKMFYTVPNFHNPSGLTYSAEKRQEVATILAGREVVLVEDDPYRELRFMASICLR